MASTGAALPPPPPPGTPFYGGYGPTIVGVCWSLGIVATVMVALRIYVYFTMVKGKGKWALIWACIAWLLAIPSIVFYTMSAASGIGNHIFIAMFSPNLPMGTLWEWVAAVTISFSVGAAKTSVALYILAIQDRTHSVGKYIIWTFVGINWICYFITVPFIFLQCDPATKLWYPLLDGNCNGIDRAFYWAVFTGAWGAATDFLLALYPTFIIYKLRIRLGLKAVLCFLMGLGCITAVCSIVKTVEFGRIRSTADPTYEIAPLMILGVTEMWVVLIASSAPPLWPLLNTRMQAFTQKQTTAGRTKTAGGILSANPFSNHSRHEGPGGTGMKMNTFTSLKSSNGSDENLSNDRIRLTHDVTIVREQV